MSIYCVKLRQTQLGQGTPFNYFPFDRAYLVPAAQRTVAFSLFRYSLVIPLNRALFTALKAVNFHRQNQLDPYRNDQNLADSPVGSGFDMFADLENGEWLMVVPTYLARDKDINPDDPTPVSREVRLAYTLSRVIGPAHNLNVAMPAITLHTPKKDIPFICALCQDIANYHSNKCSPGQSRCRDRMRLCGLPIPQDEHQRLNAYLKGENPS